MKEPVVEELTHSPVPKPILDADIIKSMTFFEALEKVLEGKRITKLEWDDKRHYGILEEEILQLHKAGEKEETLHPWIISNGDLSGDDWYTL
jgi:hypothetical protein